MIRSPFLPITGYFILSGGTFGAWASRIPAVAEFHDLSKQQLGFFLLLVAIGALLSFAVAGWATDRYGAKRVCQITGALITVSMIGVGISPNLWTLSITLLMFGAGHGSCDIAMNVWAVDWEQRSGKKLMSYFHAMWSVGGGCGAATGVFAAYQAIPYGVHFSIVTVFLCTVALFLSRNTWFDDSSKSSKARVFVLPKGALLWVAILGFCASVVEGSITDWSAILLLSLSDITQAQAALGYTAFSVAMVATRLSGHILMNRFNIAQLSQWSATITAVGMFISATSTHFTLSIIGLTLAGFGVALFFPLIFQRAGNDPVIPKGEAMAGVATLGYGGMLLGPPAIGWIAEFTSLRISFIGIGFLCLLMILLSRKLATPKVDD
jgi:MFS family permease